MANTKYIWLLADEIGIEILAPYEKVKNVAQTGDNMEATKELLNSPLVQNQMAYISSDTLIRIIESEGGILSEGEKADRDTLLVTALWLLAWDSIENENFAIATETDVENIFKLFNLLAN